MSVKRPTIKPAEISWLDQHTPYHSSTEDIYFATGQGLAESRYVFVEGNKLPERWSKPLAEFTIVETGFGTGLNFLLAASLWEKAQDTGRLHYISVEKEPLQGADLQRVHAAFPELARLSAQLLAVYPPFVAGFHALRINQRVHLTLLFGDAEEMLSKLRHSDRPVLGQSIHRIDAWFLDGFAPSKNPDMWSPAVLRLISGLSQKGATAATFTAAGNVRRGLQGNGFTVSKRAGFGSKRDMLQAIYTGSTEHAVYRRNQHFPAAGWYVQAAETERPRHVAIVGAGLAGCVTAYTLAQLGFTVSLIDAGPGPANAASGTPAAVLYTRLSQYSSPQNDFNLHAYLYACRFYPPLLDSATCGVLQLLPSERKSDAQDLVNQIGAAQYLQLLDPQSASARAGINIAQAALFFPLGTAISISRLCVKLLESPAIQGFFHSPVSDLQQRYNGWQLDLADSDKRIEADAVILCCGAQSQQFLQTEWLPLTPIRGQLTAASANSTSKKLRVVLCGDRFITPAESDTHQFGASYGLHDASLQMLEGDNKANLATARQLLQDPGFAANGAQSAWVGVRCATPDYLPIVGPVPHYSDFIETYRPLQHDKKRPLEQAAPGLPGLYLNCGYGSRGLSFAPLCAAEIASQLQRGLSPLPSTIRHALLPGRFIIRNITRGHFADP